MAKTIPGKPVEYTFGKLFDYSVWTQETVITLTNVPWSNDYEHVWRPDGGQAALNAYIDANGLTNQRIDKMSRVKVDQPIKINTPFNKANRFNYLRASNPVKPVPGGDVQKDYYFFILDVIDVAPNTTLIVVELDVMQTFGYDVTFGNCYIDRGHIGIANSKAFDNYGRDYLTIPEGLDIGGEYQQVERKSVTLMNNAWGGINGKPATYDVLVAATVDLLADDYGTEDAPKLPVAKGGIIQNIPTGVDFFVFKGANGFLNLTNKIAAFPWISQGIISITVIPEVSRYLPEFEYDQYPDSELIEGNKAPVLGLPSITHSMFANWREALRSTLPERYRHLRKFDVYPQMVVEGTTWGAKPIIIKPESWNNPDAKVVEQASIVPPNQRVMFIPQSYNAKPGASIEQRKSWIGEIPGGATPEFPYPEAQGDGDDGGDYLDFATMISNFPQLPITNNMGIAYLAANAASIAFNASSADWSQQRALRGGQTTFNNAVSEQYAQFANARTGRTTASEASAIALDAMSQAQGAQAVTGIVSGVSGGAIGGATAGPAGAAVGAGSGLVGGGIAAAAGYTQSQIQMDAQRQQVSLANRSNTTQVDQTLAASRGIASSNQKYAEFAAQGDYENQIAGNAAKVQDAQLTQPTISGQIGGEAMNLAQDKVEFALRFKRIDPSAIVALGEYWLRYGYAVRRFHKLTQLHVMSKFTYWKLTEVAIVSAPLPEKYKRTIRGILMKGVTFWVNVEDIGQVDPGTNAPKTGITL